MLQVIIGLELIAIIYLVIYNIKIKNKSKEIKSTILRVEELSVTRDILNIAGKNIDYKSKFEEINEYILDKTKVAYSSIVLKEKTSTEILATNIDEKRKKELLEYWNKEPFSSSLDKDEIVNLKKDKSNELEYQEVETDIMSAMFIPIVKDKSLLGYWLIEDTNINRLSNMDLKVINTIKETLIEIIKISSYQSAFEILTRDDEFTELKTREYLFGEYKNLLDKFDESSVFMLKINNLREINKKFGREKGNETITKVSKVLKKYIQNDSKAVRYFGPKIVFVIPNTKKINMSFTEDELLQSLEIRDILNELNNIEIKKKFIFKIKPEINIAWSTYQKNTRLHVLTDNLEKTLDDTKEKNEIIKCN